MSFCETTRRLRAETVDDLEAGDRHHARSLSYAKIKKAVRDLCRTAFLSQCRL
jgi:hypothetical protein